MYHSIKDRYLSICKRRDITDSFAYFIKTQKKYIIIKDIVNNCGIYIYHEAFALLRSIGGVHLKIREEHEKLEAQILSKYASLSINSSRPNESEDKCDIRTEYQRDRDRILHSKAFRRLKHKTQVFLSPEGDHYRTRLTHTLEVAQISRTIARALRLNEDLAEAIALGHDLGHTPFGHCGEAMLNQIHPGGFEHNVQSLKVVDVLEIRRKGNVGLNLTNEVRDGILNHRGPIKPKTLEGQIVKLCDRIAYINHDIDDAIRAGVLRASDIPTKYFDVLGSTHSKRINTLILDVIYNSVDKDVISQSEEISSIFLELRDYMFKNVYLNLKAKKEEEKAMHIIEALYLYFVANPEKMPFERYEDYKKDGSVEAIKDYVAGMSDRYAVSKYKEIFVPRFWT